MEHELHDKTRGHTNSMEHSNNKTQVMEHAESFIYFALNTNTNTRHKFFSSTVTVAPGDVLSVQQRGTEWRHSWIMGSTNRHRDPSQHHTPLALRQQASRH